MSRPRDGFPIERSNGVTVTVSAVHERDDVTRTRVINEPMTTSALRSWNEELSAVSLIDQLSRLTLSEASKYHRRHRKIFSSTDIMKVFSDNIILCHAFVSRRKEDYGLQIYHFPFYICSLETIFAKIALIAITINCN